MNEWAIFGVAVGVCLSIAALLWVAVKAYEAYQYSCYRGLKGRILDARSDIVDCCGMDGELRSREVAKILRDLYDNTWPDIEKIISDQQVESETRAANNDKQR